MAGQEALKPLLKQCTAIVNCLPLHARSVATGLKLINDYSEHKIKGVHVMFRAMGLGGESGKSLVHLNRRELAEQSEDKTTGGRGILCSLMRTRSRMCV